MKGFFSCEADYDKGDIVIFGAPFDSTTSYRPGARFASKTMRSESYSLETYSPYIEADLEDHSICDYGDLELPLGDTSLALKAIEDKTRQILSDDKLPLMIGGEHLVALGAIKAVYEKYPDLHIIHFDAHTDLRDDYLGVKLSHATVIRRAWEIVGDNRIFQFGIRSGEREEFIWAKDHLRMNKFDFKSLEEIIEKLKDKPVYFTLDLDILDPSVFPGTGTPEPGGVGFIELLEAVRKVCKLSIVACDINELCPVYDQSGVSTIAALKILREILLELSIK